MNYVPLTWPVELQQLSRWRRFFWGISFIGSNQKMRKTLFQQMRLRTADCLALWDGYTNEEKDISGRISQVVYSSLGWPNRFFIPQDCFGILVWDHTGDLGTTSTLTAIESEFDLAEFPSQEWERLLSCTFGEVVRMMVPRIQLSSSLCR
jgi:hypothetical protein